MSQRSYAKSKGRRGKPTFLGLPHAVLDHANYIRLSNSAKALLNDIGRQYNGFNNGDLCLRFSLMKQRGWKSKETLSNARQELLHYRMIVPTQYGGLNKVSLYALTWHKIDKLTENKDGLKTGDLLSLWKDLQPAFERKACGKSQQQKKSSQYGNRDTPVRGSNL